MRERKMDEEPRIAGLDLRLLPESTTDTMATNNSARSTAFAKSRPRILVVDDDAAIRRLLGVALRKLGCVVTAVDDATEVMAMLESGTDFALVITDQRLARGSGVALITQARAMLGRAAPPFLLFSGGNPPDPRPEGVELLSKPSSVETLYETVKRVLAHRRKLGSNDVARSTKARDTMPSASTPTKKSASISARARPSTRTTAGRGRTR